MKLEIKHLSAYLPYGLKVKWGADTANLVGLVRDAVILNGEFWMSSQKTSIDNIKPILRPLSDLTKEIEVNGEKFVPSKEFEKLYLNDCKWGNNSIGFGIIGKSGFMTNLCFMNNEIIGECPLAIYELLIKWHFDIFGLLDANLAIDINSLNK